MEILNVREQAGGYLVNGYITVLPDDADYPSVLAWVAAGREVMPPYTPTELKAIAEAAKPKEVTMAQFRAALILSGLKQEVDTVVANSGDALLINDYEYRATVRRDWPSFVAMATTLGKTDTDIDTLFALAATL